MYELYKKTEMLPKTVKDFHIQDLLIHKFIEVVNKRFTHRNDYNYIIS